MPLPLPSPLPAGDAPARAGVRDRGLAQARRSHRASTRSPDASAWLPLLLLGLAFAGACGDDDASPADAGLDHDSADAAPADAGLDAAPVDAAPHDATVDAPACDALLCDGECVDPETDARHCGGCDAPCPAFGTCERGACVCEGAACASGGYPGWPFGPDYVVEEEVVRDRATGLVWQRRTDGEGRSAEDAAAYCEALELGGRDDWRLPLRIELVSILDGTVTPTLDAAAFPDTVEDYHWSASRPRHSDTLGYSAYFGQGETVTAALSGSGAHVRCVAGAIAVGEPWVVEDGEVRMPSLALAWSQAPLETRSHGEAEAACAAEGMRLPTLNELQAIVDEARRDPAIDPGFFPGTPSERFWTATIRDFGELLPWVVDFTDGQTFLESASAPHPARCVRDL